MPPDDVVHLIVVELVQGVKQGGFVGVGRGSKGSRGQKRGEKNEMSQARHGSDLYEIRFLMGVVVVVVVVRRCI